MTDLHINIIQTHIIWENKEANFKILEQQLSLIKEKKQIVILPEMFTTGFTNNAKSLAESMDGDSIQQLKRLAQKHSCILVTSLIIQEAGKYFNRLCWIYPNRNIHTYDKKHLFSYAKENEFYTPGYKRLITRINNFNFFSMVCYDLRFPVWCRQKPANDEYDVLVCIANWPASRIEQWQTLLAARAIENQAYVIGVNRVGLDGNNIFYNGKSCVINPYGKQVAHFEHEQEGVLSYTIKKNEIENYRQEFGIGKDADDFFLLP